MRSTLLLLALVLGALGQQPVIPECRPLIDEIFPRPTGGGGVNVRVCCDMSEIWFAQFGGRDQLSRSTDSGWLKIDDLAQSGNADIFRVNNCRGLKELIFGDAYKEDNCQTHVGATIPLITSIRESYEFEMNKWTVICYRWPSGCQYCRLHVFCNYQYDPECFDVSLKHRVVEVSNSSLKLAVIMGKDLPVTGELKVTMFENSLNAPSRIVDRKKFEARAGQENIFATDQELKPNTYYVFEICLEVVPSEAFKTAYSLTFHEKVQRVCQNESAKTIGDYFYGRTGASSSADASVTLIFCTLVALLSHRFNLPLTRR